MERRVWTWPQQHSDDAKSRCSVLTGGSSCLWVSCDFNSHCIRQKKLDLWWWETFYYNLFKKTFYSQLLGSALIICLLKCFLLISSRQNAVKSEWRKIIQTLFFLLVNCFTLPKWSLYSLIFVCKKRLFNSWSLISSWHDNLDFFSPLNRLGGEDSGESQWTRAEWDGQYWTLYTLCSLCAYCCILISMKLLLVNGSWIYTRILR